MSKSTVSLPVKTIDVVARLNTTYFRLAAAMKSGKMPLPAKDSSGQYVWSEADIANARKALATDRRRKAVAP